jgi:hypothetical protein
MERHLKMHEGHMKKVEDTYGYRIANVKLLPI